MSTFLMHTEPDTVPPHEHVGEKELREWLNRRHAARLPRQFGLGQVVKVVSGRHQGAYAQVTGLLWSAGQGVRYWLTKHGASPYNNFRLPFEADELELVDPVPQGFFFEKFEGGYQ